MKDTRQQSATMQLSVRRNVQNINSSNMKKLSLFTLKKTVEKDIFAVIHFASKLTNHSQKEL